MVGDIFRHDGAGADEGVTADGVATDDGAVGAERCTSFDKGGADLVHLADFRTGVVDVGEYHRRAAKNAVFQSDTFIDADVVLDLAFVADDYVGTNDDILADVAVVADFGTGEDVGEVPDFRPGTDLDFVIDGGGGMCENAGIFFGHLVSILDTGLRRYDRRRI